MLKENLKKFSLIILWGGIFIFFGALVYAQQENADLEKRVGALEKYVDTIRPTLADFSTQLEEGIKKYTEGLENSLTDYSQALQKNLEERLQGLTYQKVYLNPSSNAFQRIETNVGSFLIAVQKISAIQNGYHLTLNIANPNYADYKDFKLRLVWGRKWEPGDAVPYEKWRQSLTGAEFSFQGALEKGVWNTVEVDLTPAQEGQLAHIECEMEVTGVEMQIKGVK